MAWLKTANNWLAILCLITSTTVCGASPARKPIWVKKFECVEQPYLKTNVHQCVLRSPRNERQYFSLVVETLEIVYKANLDFNLFAQYQTTRSYIYGTTIDYCEFLKDSQSNSNPVASIIYGIAYRNFPQLLVTCPIKGFINLTNVEVTGDMIPPYIPPGMYASDIRAYNKRNQTLIAAKVQFSITRPGIIENAFLPVG